MRKRNNVSRSTQPLSSLRKENKKLKRDLQLTQAENLRLRKQIDTLTAAGGKTIVAPSAMIFKKKESPQKALLAEGASSRRRYSSTTYAGYLFLSVKESSLGRIIRRIASFFRRLRVFRWVASILLIIITAVLASAVFVTAIPLLLLSSVTTLFAVIFKARSANLRMANALRGKHIRVLIPHDHAVLGDGSFLDRCAMEMATHSHSAVIVVSPHLISGKGLGGKGIYFTARQEATNLFVVRKGYYFILKRKVLCKLDPLMTVIY